MKISIPQADLQRNITLEPNWYRGKFVKMEVKPSKDKGSTNYIASIEIETDKRIMEHGFNSKAMGFMQSFVESVTGEKVAVVNGVVQGNADFEPEANYGKFLMVKVDNEPFEGRLVSKIKGFLPDGADTSSPFAV